MQRKKQVGEFWVCVIFFACVCVGVLDSKTTSNDPSSSYPCVVCAGRFPTRVPGWGRYAPPGYVQHSRQCPEICFWMSFAIFSDFLS
jgi:hypothetical protein